MALLPLKSGARTAAGMSQDEAGKSTIQPGQCATTGKSDGRCHKCGCNGPNPGYESLSDAVIEQEFATLRPHFWTLAKNKKSIARCFTCRNFKAAIAFINAAGAIAEREDIQHHPDLHLTEYRQVEIRIYTHAAGGLTEYDFKLAHEIENIEVDYSPKWLKVNPAIAAAVVAGGSSKGPGSST